MLNMTMEQYIQQAQECTQAGDKTDTIANYRLAIELDANQPASMYNRHSAHSEQKFYLIYIYKSIFYWKI